MIVQTYQSQAVLRILQRGEIYRAKPSISFSGEYQALIDILNLKCECPIFCVVKGRKQNTGGKVSSSVRLTLDVPDKFVKLTEFSVWADFMYAFKYTRPGSYKSLRAGYEEEITTDKLKQIVADLKRQKRLNEYEYPQVILEKINPAWLKSYKSLKLTGGKNTLVDKAESFWNRFRK